MIFKKSKAYLKNEFFSTLTEKYSNFKGKFGVVLLKENILQNNVVKKKYFKAVNDIVIDV